MENVQSTEVVETEETQEEVQSEEIQKTEAPENTEETQEKENFINQEKVQQRINKKHAEMMEYKGKWETVVKELAKYKKDSPTPVAPTPNDFVDAYGDVDKGAYQKAHNEYLDKYFAWKENQNEAQSYEQQIQERIQERQLRYTEQIEELRKTVPDVDTYISKPIFSDVLQAAILESDESGKLALYLGKNEAEAHKLNQMKEPHKIQEYLGRLEGRLDGLTMATSKTPSPLEPVGDEGGVRKRLDDIKDDDEWYGQWKKKQAEKLKSG